MKNVKVKMIPEFRFLVFTILLALFGFYQNVEAQTKFLSDEELAKTRPFMDLKTALKKPEKVVVLYLVDKGLTELPADLSKMKNIQQLEISHNKDLGKLPEVIAQLKNLQVLKADYCGMTDLPNWLSDLPHLRTISVDGNKIEMFPQSLCVLSDLEKLSIANNTIERIPPEIAGMTSLKHLDINTNNLKGLAPELAEVTTLEFLNIAYNGLQDVPEVYSKLKNLRKVRLYGNLFSSSIRKKIQKIFPGRQTEF